MSTVTVTTGKTTARGRVYTAMTGRYIGTARTEGLVVADVARVRRLLLRHLEVAQGIKLELRPVGHTKNRCIYLLIFLGLF